MRRVLFTIVTLAWGLWFGGLIVLFMTVTSLFKTFASRHDLAGQAAAQIFRTFNAYQLALAAIALLATFAWRVFGPPRLKAALFTLFAIATVGGCVITIYLAPQMQRLQAQGLTTSSAFGRLHEYSMLAYLVETIALLMAGLLLAWTESPAAPARSAGGQQINGAH